MADAPSRLNITGHAPNLEFHSPILWKAVKLIEDRDTGYSYAVATAFDPLRNEVLLIGGSSAGPVPLRRVFRSVKNRWEMVTDKDFEFAVLRLADGK
jgi:hypothetical protein